MLKHTQLFEGQLKPLSAPEVGRVIHHSAESKAYWEAIQRKLNITLRGESVGAVLQRLCKNLKKGGAHGGKDGKEYNAGQDANAGISTFFTWYQALTPEERASLEKLGSGALREMLGRLADPVHPTHQSALYCVEMIAANIETIIANHPTLYNQYPANKEAMQHISLIEADAAMKAAGTALRQAMARPSYQVTSSYGP